MSRRSVSRLTTGACIVLALAATIAARAQDLYVSAGAAGTIYKLTPSGAIDGQISSGLLYAYGLAFDSSGNLYANDGDSSVVKLTPGGAASTFTTSLSRAREMAVDSAGNLYVATDGFTGSTANTSGAILKFTPGGTQSVFASGLVAAGWGLPEGLAFDSAGNLYVSTYADTGVITSSVLEFSPNGQETVVAENENGFVRGLAFDNSGNLYQANWGQDDGNGFIEEGSSVFASGLNSPLGMAFDVAGNLYESDPAATISKFDPSGVETSFNSQITGTGQLAFAPLATPEPGSLALLVSAGIAGAVFLRRARFWPRHLD